MAIDQLQLPQGPVINSLADWSPLERLVQNWQAQQKEAAQNEQAYRDVGGGGQGQQPQGGGFLQDLGRKFGLLPEAAPPQVAAVPARVPQTGTDPMANYSNAIANIESGGRYDLLGPVTKTGDRAIGKYQVMGNNVPEWTAAALGKPMNVADFRASPEAQEAVFKHRFGMYAQKYGPENAAKAWFAGERGMENPNARDQLGTSVASYAEKFRRNADLPAGTTPPVVAQGGDMQVPSPPGVAPPLQERAVPAAPVVASDAPEARAVQNLVSGQPAAAAGFDRETIARLARNPETRKLAFAILQKQMEPGTYTYEKIGDRLMALHNKDPRLNKEVARGPLVVGGSIATEDPSRPGQYGFQTPPEAPKVIHQKEDEIVRVPIPGRPGEYTTFGGEGVGKIQRQIDERTQAALAKGYPQETADYYGLNNKFPKDDLTAKEVGTLTDNQKMVNSGKMVLDNVTEMKRLSPEAWSGMGASERAYVVSKLLPGFAIPKGATNTEVLGNLSLQNVAGQAKSMFGSRLAFGEVKLLERLETNPNMSRATREQIYPQIERIVQRHMDQIEAENEAIRNKTYKKPGGGPTHGAPATAPPPAATGPSLNDFMTKARAANPGVPDSELTSYWNSKYGGK